MQKEQLYRTYTAEMLRGLATALGNNVAHSYVELVKEFDERPGVEESRTADDVIEDIRGKLSRFGGE